MFANLIRIDVAQFEHRNSGLCLAKEMWIAGRCQLTTAGANPQRSMSAYTHTPERQRLRQWYKCWMDKKVAGTWIGKIMKAVWHKIQHWGWIEKTERLSWRVPAYHGPQLNHLNYCFRDLGRGFQTQSYATQFIRVTRSFVMWHVCDLRIYIFCSASYVCKLRSPETDVASCLSRQKSTRSHSIGSSGCLAALKQVSWKVSFWTAFLHSGTFLAKDR